MLFTRFTLPLLLLVGIATLPSCSNAFGVHGEGAAVTEQRTPGSFTDVQLNIDADVVLHTDSSFRIELTGQRNILDVLTTRVTGNELRIDYSDCVANHSPVTLHLYAPSYVRISISGSGGISNAGVLNSASLQLKVLGSGSFNIGGVQATSVTTKIDGSGTITISGTSQTLTSTVMGSGNLQSYGLACTTATLTSSGSGNSEVNAAQQLNVDISGSGNVYYRSTPAVNASISGSGRVIHVN